MLDRYIERGALAIAKVRYYCLLRLPVVEGSSSLSLYIMLQAEIGWMIDGWRVSLLLYCIVYIFDFIHRVNAALNVHHLTSTHTGGTGCNKTRTKGMW